MALTAPVNFKLEPSEKAALVQKANKLGLKTSDYLRFLVRGAIGSSKAEELAALKIFPIKTEELKPNALKSLKTAQAEESIKCSDADSLLQVLES